LHAHAAELDRAELGADLKRGGAALDRAPALDLAVVLELYLVAADHDLEFVPLAFLEVLDAGLHEVELLAAQEEVVVAARAGLVLELEVDVPGEIPGRHDADVAPDLRVDDEYAVPHREPPLVRLGLAFQGRAARLLLPAGEVLAVEQRGEALLRLEVV